MRWYLHTVSTSTSHSEACWDRPALFSQQSLPVLTVCSAAWHGAQQVRVDLYHFINILWCCNTLVRKIKIYPCRLHADNSVHNSQLHWFLPMYLPADALESTATITPCRNLNARVVVPWFRSIQTPSSPLQDFRNLEGWWTKHEITALCYTTASVYVSTRMYFIRKWSIYKAEPSEINMLYFQFHVYRFVKQQLGGYAKKTIKSNYTTIRSSGLTRN